MHYVNVGVEELHSRASLRQMFDTRFDGESKRVHETLFKTARPIAEKVA